MRRSHFSIPLTLLMCCSLVSPALIVSRAQSPAPSRRARPQSLQQAADGGWPRGYSLSNEAQIMIFQPQVSSWENQKHMIALAAVSYVPKGEEKPTLGTITIEADTSVALQERLVKFSTLKISEANFQTLSKEQTREITTEIEKTIPDQERVIGLDRVLSQVSNS